MDWKTRIMITSMMIGLLPFASYALDDEYFEVDVAVTDVPSARVTFTWDAQADGGSVEIYRRNMGDVGSGTWSLRGTTWHPTNDYTDNISTGVLYEYKIFRPAFDAYDDSASFMPVSIDAPLEDERGILLFVVDKSMTNALAGEIRRIEMDIAADGWTVQRMNYDRDGTGSHTNLRALIVQAYNDHPSEVKALYLFGHLPVTMSGYMAPDGHDNEAHATDGYYADMDGTWTDSGNYEAGENEPGDGRFDQSYYPDDIELMVGRVDMANMTAYYKTEEEYLRDYAHKSHAWRCGAREVPLRGTWNSRYLWMERNWMMSMFGTHVLAIKEFQPNLATNENVFCTDFAYWNGSDPYYTDHPFKSIFFINFGSHKQKWERDNNPMRGVMAQPDWGLSCAWGARPAWFFHHLNAGKPLGYSAWRTMNNYGVSPHLDYYPIGDYSWMDGYVSINMMGDPTIRMHPVKPPMALSVAQSGSDAVLSWNEPEETDIRGYHVYSATNRLGPYTRLTTGMITDCVFTNTGVGAVKTYYQVRTVKAQTTPCGSYLNQSPGAFALLYADGRSNTAPSAVAYEFTASKNTPTPVSVSGADPDGDEICPMILQNPEYGMLRRHDAGLTYFPENNRTATDTYVYVMSDGMAVSPPVTCTVTVADHTLLEWRFISPVSNGFPQVVTSTWSAAGMATSVLTTGSGLILDESQKTYTEDGLCVRDADSVSLDTNDFMECSVCPQAGYAMRLENIGFGLWAEEGRPLQAQLRFSTNDFANWEIVDLGPTHIVSMNGRGWDSMHGMPLGADLTGYPTLQNMTNGVDFRLYLWGTDGASDQVGIGKLGVSNVDVAVAGLCRSGLFCSIQTDISSLNMNEGETQDFHVRLTAAPEFDLTVTVCRAEGDADIAIEEGASLVFDPMDWAFWQTVTVASAQDTDYSNDTAVVRCSSPGMADMNISVTVDDDEFNPVYSLPWTETFENDGTNAGTLGDLNGQRGWTAEPSTAGQVQNNDAYEGSQACDVADGTISHTFMDQRTNVYVKLHMKPVMSDKLNDIDPSVTAVFYVQSNRYVVAYSGSTPVVTSVRIAPSDWIVFDVHADYGAETWSLDVNGTNAVNKFPFYSSQSNFSALVIDGGVAGTAVVDRIEMAWQANEPVNDADGDGMPDDYEEQYSGGPTNLQPYADDDGDGVPNLHEYIGHTVPTNADSFFYISNLESRIADDHYIIRWDSVSNRVYAVHWGTNLPAGFGLLSSELPATPPQNVYTDEIHTVEERGYYRIDVRMDD